MSITNILSFDDVHIQEIDYASLSLRAKELFSFCDVTFHSELGAPNNFHFYKKIVFPSDDAVFVTQRLQTYDDKETDLITYVSEETPLGEMIGWGYMKYNTLSNKQYFKHKPFVGFTSTKEEFKGEGYGIRRLLTMNYLAQSLHGFPLYSGVFIGDDSKKSWKHLLRAGCVKSFKEDDKLRYRFV